MMAYLEADDDDGGGGDDDIPEPLLTN